jgi:glycerol-3-phosphate acyltransferase PlsX
MQRTTVALDLLGGDEAPASVIAGARLALAADPDLAVTLVGPPELAEDLPVVVARQVVGMDEDPARGVRSKRDATVRIAARLVRDGAADAMVSVGSTGAALAAAVFSLGRVPGVTRPALAVIVPAPGGPLVLSDIGASSDAGADQLVQVALAAAAYATVALGIDQPRVGLLTIGEEPGKGDQLRRDAWPLLAALDLGLGGPLRFVGSVEGRDVPLGGTADVVVTDGFTGNVLLKGLEGAVRAVAQVLVTELSATAETRAAAKVLLPSFAEVSRRWGPEGAGGAILLGVPGVVVVGHGSSSPAAVAACLHQAAEAHRAGLVGRTTQALGLLVARRREQAGLQGSPS